MILDLTANDNRTILSEKFKKEEICMFQDATDYAAVETVIIDERTDVLSMYKVPFDYKRMSLWGVCDNRIFDLSQHDIEEYQMQQMEKKKYWIVKMINKIKIKANTFWRKTIFDTYPVVLQVESTSFCNAKCIMCSHYYKDSATGQHLRFDESTKLKEVLPYVETVMIHGIGEPFLNPDIVKWLEFYKMFGVHLSTFTNMTILNDTIVDSIKKSFTALHISCDGCSKDAYELIRQNLKFEVFIENVKRLHNEVPALKLHMHTVAMRQNLSQLEQFVAFAANLGFSSITYSNLTVNPLIGNEMDSIRNYPRVAKEKFLQAIQLAEGLEIEIKIPDEYLHIIDDDRLYEHELYLLKTQQTVDCNIITEKVNSKNTSDLYATEEIDLKDIVPTKYECLGLCDWLSDLAYLDLNGNLAVCCSKYFLTMGNIKEYKSFRELWNSRQYQKMRSLFYNEEIPKMCKGCRYIIDKGLHNLEILNEDEEFKNVEAIGKLYKKLGE